MAVTEKVAYLKGLADGMKLDADKDANKLLLAVIDTLDEMAELLDAVDSDLAEVEEQIDDVDADLADLEDYVYDDDCCCDDDCCDDELYILSELHGKDAFLDH